MQAMVHAKTCIQCGLCPAVCPDVFTLDPGEPARAISGPVPEECRLAAQEAADSCPVGAMENPVNKRRGGRGPSQSAAPTALPEGEPSP